VSCFFVFVQVSASLHDATTTGNQTSLIVGRTSNSTTVEPVRSMDTIPRSVFELDSVDTGMQTTYFDLFTVSVAVQCPESDFTEPSSCVFDSNTTQHFSPPFHSSELSRTTQLNTDTPHSSQLTATDSQVTDSQPTDNHSSDRTYDPDLDSDMDTDKIAEQPTELENIKKFLVFETELDKLFTFCSRCSARITDISKHTTGSMLSVTTTCQYYHTVTWHSQPLIHRMPAGNLLLSAAILLSGSTYSQTERLADILRLPILSDSEFYRIQRTYLFPPIDDYWTMHQTALLSVLATEDLYLCGDARSDSPGFCAKYSSYTLMDMKTTLILDQQLVTLSEEDVGNSVMMERLGLERGLDFLISSGMTIHTLASGHRQTHGGSKFSEGHLP
jgi:hypothetical protein